MADLSLVEAAAELGCSVAWLRERVRVGGVEYQRYGRTVAFTAAQLDAVRAAHRVVPAGGLPLPLRVMAASLGATSRSRAVHRSRSLRGL